MIGSSDVYQVVASTVPLYVAMILAYVSVKWWKVFTPEQCSGINKFVAKFSIPLLSFQVISSNNMYKMNAKLLLSDFLQKLFAILLLAATAKITSRGGLNCIITGLSLSTLPNTLIIGLPLLKAMYGNEAYVYLSQIVVLQSLIWNNMLLFLFEYGAVKAASLAPISDSTVEANRTQEGGPKADGEEARNRSGMRFKAMLVLLTVGKKIIINPNTHAALLGLIWSTIQFRWNLKLPEIIEHSILIMSNGGLGMAMFSLGLFMASQSIIIACRSRMALVALGMKFFAGPALMAAGCFALGMRGTLLKVAIVQAALPQGIAPFVFAKEYNVNPDILGTGVILGLLVALPVALVYYSLLSL